MNFLNVEIGQDQTVKSDTMGMHSIRLLTPHVQYDPQETLLSYAARLSSFHTGMGPRRLLADLGISFSRFVSGKPEAVAKFAAATGNSHEVFARMAISLNSRHVSFRGERLSKSFLSPRAVRYCPQCSVETPLMEDRQHQILWCFRHVHRCIHHSRWLCSSSDKMAVDLQQVTVSSEDEKAVPAAGPVPEYLLWLERRLSGRDVADWMTDQSFEQILAASEMVGGILNHGHKVNLSKLSVLDQERATKLGFTIYRAGADCVADALTTIRTTSPATAVQAGSLAMYGRLFDWLDRRCKEVDPGPIRDILRDHIVKHSAIDSGELVLGVEITKRKFHSLQSLSLETGISHFRLSKLLQMLGHVPRSASDFEKGKLVFDADEVVNFVQDYSSAIPLRDVPLYLGASKHQFDVLYAAEILSPLIPRNGPGSVRNVVFSRRSLDAFLSKVANFPDAKIDEGSALNTISYACQRGGGTTVEIIMRMLDGTLPAFRQPEKFGLAGVLVSPIDAISSRPLTA